MTTTKIAERDERIASDSLRIDVSVEVSDGSMFDRDQLADFLAGPAGDVFADDLECHLWIDGSREDSPITSEGSPRCSRLNRATNTSKARAIQSWPCERSGTCGGTAASRRGMPCRKWSSLPTSPTALRWKRLSTAGNVSGCGTRHVGCR
jgi:hypothetical protein